MKRLLLCTALLLVIALMGAYAAAGKPRRATDALSQPGKPSKSDSLMASAPQAAAAYPSEGTTTLLVYMCGADLQYDACCDIYEMALAETGDDVNIAILAGGASDWEFDEIKGNTRSLITIRDGDFESIEDWGWKSMGSEESLLEFLEYGMTAYPADRTMVVLWNHGAGSEAGVCFDYTTKDQDGLSLNEINDVLYDLDDALGGFHIDVFGCDACMMATYEMAAMLAHYDIDYYIGSEELESGTGWCYTPWLQALDDDPGMDGAALCRMIVDSYVEDAQAQTSGNCLTMSAISLEKIPDLQETIEGFAATLLDTIEGGSVSDVRRGRSQMYTFGGYVNSSWDMVDMGEMLDAYAHFDPDTAAAARRQLGEAVIYQRQTDDLNPCSGLSVLIPQDTKREFEAYSDGMDLSFYMPNWIGFVKAYAGAIYGGSYNLTATAPQQVSGGGYFSWLTGMFSATQAYDWDESAGEYAASEPDEVEIGPGAGDYAFEAHVSKEDLRYLDYVEGMLLMDLSDDELSAYVDFGLMRNNLVDWSTGSVYSLFDGTWPIFGGQPVPLYDQLSNDRGRRSLIPVKLNGEYTYLVVEFTAGEREGRIVGANAGYDENGLPIRNTTRLKAGDSIVPVYTMYVDTGAEEMETAEFDGDEIIWRDGMTVTYEALDDTGEPIDMVFCFVLNDVFGEMSLTDLVAFEV